MNCYQASPFCSWDDPVQWGGPSSTERGLRDKAQAASVCLEDEDLVFLWQNMSSRGDAHRTFSRDLY